MTRVENPMVTGEWPYNIPFTEDPDTECPSCGMGLFEGDAIYEWDGDDICGDCLIENINRLTDKERSEMSGESIAVTEQMMEEARTAEDYAEIFYIEHSHVDLGGY
jgi:hypothetical protein